MSSEQKMLDAATAVVEQAMSAGADAADAIVVEGTSLSLSQRLGKPEHVERSEGTDLGLRVFIGKRQAMVSSSDTSKDALAELVDRCVSMAKTVPEDPFCGLAPEDMLATTDIDLDEFDAVEPDAETLKNLAIRAEEAARAIDGVSNSEGAEASWGRYRVGLAASNGFARSRTRSSHSISASVLAGDGTQMERDYDYDSAVHGADMRSPEDIGKSAGERAVKRLNPRKVETQKVPIIFDPRVSNSILRHLSGAINGASIARGTSFLLEKLGEKIFPDNITIIDDPLRPRGMSSKSFDAEGLPTRKRKIIDGGVLTSWTMDLRSARQLGLESTGSASRGTSSPPSPSTTNLYMEAGELSPEALISDIKDGLYVTEMIGMGVNGVTGDYSRGATGFWIENGVITFPVSEITIAGNLTDIFANITCADDLEFRHGTDAPTLRIEGMTLAGI